MTWGQVAGQAMRQWFVMAADTGPGVDLAARAPIVRALKAVTDEAHARQDASGIPQASEAAGMGGDDVASTPGEGLGLSIVKQLCELLDATVELDSRPGDGTTVRVLLPLRYESRES
jgi:signal transduction histidine kinase